jgi:hypothetical protein
MPKDGANVRADSVVSVEKESDPLKERKLHLAELEKRVKRDDYSPEKMALYREALARARREVKELEQSNGND